MNLEKIASIINFFLFFNQITRKIQETTRNVHIRIVTTFGWNSRGVR